MSHAMPCHAMPCQQVVDLCKRQTSTTEGTKGMFHKAVISKKADACRKTIIWEFSPLKATPVETQTISNQIQREKEIKV